MRSSGCHEILISDLFAKMVENDPRTKMVQTGLKTCPGPVFDAEFEFIDLNYPQKLFWTIFEIFIFFTFFAGR